MQKTEQISKYIEDGIFPMHGWNALASLVRVNL